MVGSVVRCSLCGKESILAKSWEEKLETRRGISLIKHEQYICPDSECQKKVNQEIKKRHELAQEREEATKNREAKRLSGKNQPN